MRASETKHFSHFRSVQNAGELELDASVILLGLEHQRNTFVFGDGKSDSPLGEVPEIHSECECRRLLLQIVNMPKAEVLLELSERKSNPLLEIQDVLGVLVQVHN